MKLGGRFHRLFGATLVSATGTGMHAAALPLLVLQITSSPVSLSLVVVALVILILTSRVNLAWLVLAAFMLGVGQVFFDLAAQSAVPVRTEIAEGIRWLLGNRTLRAMAAITCLSNVVASAQFAMLALLAKQVLGLPDIGFGLLLTATAVGATAGGLTVSVVSKRFGSGTVILAGKASVILLTLVAYPRLNNRALASATDKSVVRAGESG